VPARKHHEKSIPLLRCRDALVGPDQEIPLVLILVSTPILRCDVGDIFLGIQPLAGEQNYQQGCDGEIPERHAHVQASKGLVSSCRTGIRLPNLRSISGGSATYSAAGYLSRRLLLPIPSPFRNRLIAAESMLDARPYSQCHSIDCWKSG